MQLGNDTETRVLIFRPNSNRCDAKKTVGIDFTLHRLHYVPMRAAALGIDVIACCHPRFDTADGPFVAFRGIGKRHLVRLNNVYQPIAPPYPFSIDNCHFFPIRTKL